MLKLSCASVLLAIGMLSVAPLRADNVCDAGEAPDYHVVTIGGNVYFVNQQPVLDDIPSSHGVVGEIAAFSFGSESCNLGSCWATVDVDSPLHPIISQNMFRLVNGRFEQIGQSWVKHTRGPGGDDKCGTCQPGDATHEGVSCSDIYNNFLNGRQDLLGPRWQVNASTGDFVYPFHLQGIPGPDPTFKRLQVHTADLTGGTYFAEVQYVHPEETRAGAANSIAYRKVLVQDPNPPFPLLLTGPTVSGAAAIEAWNATDPAVRLTPLDTCDGRMFVASRVTNLGNGQWQYEYAVQNVNSDRSAGRFSVPAAVGTSVSGIGFHDVDYHTDVVYSGTDWPGTHDAGAKRIVWSTEDYAQNPDANALRWGTLYNYRFTANVAPTLDRASVDLFKPGSSSRLYADAWVPGTPAPAGQPYAAKSTVPKVVYSPAGSLAYTVTIRDAAGAPLPGVTVTVQAVNGLAESLVSWCAGQSHTPAATTNASGVATFHIRAGGCIDPARLGFAPFVVSADGIEMARVGAASTDAVDNTGSLPTDPGYVKSSPAKVALSDAVFHTAPIATGGTEFCTDLDSSVDDCDGVGLTDALLIGPDVSNGVACNVPGAGGNGSGNGG